MRIASSREEIAVGNDPRNHIQVPRRYDIAAPWPVGQECTELQERCLG